MISEGTLKRRAAGLSLAYNIILTVLKLIAAGITGSVSLLSEAVHSATDVVASFFAFLSVKAAAVPPDEDHPYGHGKIESLAGFGESILLLGIVVYILVEAIHRLSTGGSVNQLGFGLIVMGISSVTSLGVARYVSSVGKKTDSIALRSNGQHLMVDFWTSVGVFLALGITRLTGWQNADAICALLFAAWIAFGAWKMIREAVDQLIDRAVPEEELEVVRQILRDSEGVISFHHLRTRHSGNFHHIDVHVVVDRDWSVVQAHDLADVLEDRIEKALPPAQAVIHIDPFDPIKAKRG